MLHDRRGNLFSHFSSISPQYWRWDDACISRHLMESCSPFNEAPAWDNGCLSWRQPIMFLLWLDPSTFRWKSDPKPLPLFFKVSRSKDRRSRPFGELDRVTETVRDQRTNDRLWFGSAPKANDRHKGNGIFTNFKVVPRDLNCSSSTFEDEQRSGSNLHETS